MATHSSTLAWKIPWMEKPVRLQSMGSQRVRHDWATTLATWCEEPTHWKRPWCWEKLKAGPEGVDRGRDSWMASLNQWTWAWASSGRRWRTGKPGMLQSLGLQRVGHDWVTKQQRALTIFMHVDTTSKNPEACLNSSHWMEIKNNLQWKQILFLSWFRYSKLEYLILKLFYFAVLYTQKFAKIVYQFFLHSFSSMLPSHLI